VFCHYPIWSAGVTGPLNEELNSTIDRLMRRYNVAAYFSGHEHNLQHLLIDNFHYYVSGAGREADGNWDGFAGLPLRSAKFRFPSSTLTLGGFVQVQVWETTMNVSFWRDNGLMMHVSTQIVPDMPAPGASIFAPAPPYNPNLPVSPKSMQSPSAGVIAGTNKCFLANVSGTCIKVEDTCTTGGSWVDLGCPPQDSKPALCCLEPQGVRPPAVPIPIGGECSFAGMLGTCKLATDGCTGTRIDAGCIASGTERALCCLAQDPQPVTTNNIAGAAPPTNRLATPVWVIVLICVGIFVLLCITAMLIYFLVTKQPAKRGGDGYALI